MNQQQMEPTAVAVDDQQQQNGGDDVEQLLSATATKSKLDKLMTDFATFDDVMRIGTRVRWLLCVTCWIDGAAGSTD